MPERAAGKQSEPCLQLPLRHWNCSRGSLGWLCRSSFSATGCTDRGRNVSQISPWLLFHSTFNLSCEIAGALSMRMRTFFGKSNSQWGWNRGEKKNYYNLSPSVMKCWDRRKKRTNGELPWCSIFKKQRLNLIGTDVLTADSHGIAKCHHLQLHEAFLTLPCQRGIRVRNDSIEGNLEWVRLALYENVNQYS